MTLYKIRVSKDMFVEAENEDNAIEKFWREWEISCNENNATMENDIAESLEIRKATKEEIEAEK